jgi:hypothetical protein
LSQAAAAAAVVLQVESLAVAVQALLFIKLHTH